MKQIRNFDVTVNDMKTIILSEIVTDTYTNASGYGLFVMLNDAISNKEKVSVSFKGATPTSSSFLNSSLGELIEDYGMDVFKTYVKLVDLNKSQVTVLRRYFDSINNINA